MNTPSTSNATAHLQGVMDVDLIKERITFPKSVVKIISTDGRGNAMEAGTPDWVEACAREYYEQAFGKESARLYFDSAGMSLLSDIIRKHAARQGEGKFAPLEGILTRAGEFPIREEETVGYVVSCTREQLEAVKHLPMYRRVIITAVEP